jgi:hypothetical protein
MLNWRIRLLSAAACCWRSTMTAVSPRTSTEDSSSVIRGTRVDWGFTLFLGTLGLLLLSVGNAYAFALFGDPPTIPDVQQELEAAARWPSLDGQTVLLNVASMPGFGAALGTTPEEIAAANQVVADAFAALASPELQFNVSLEDSGVAGFDAGGPAAGFDIDVFAVPGSHPLLIGTGFFGIADLSTESVPSRLLTNGQSFAGFNITGADVYLNIDAVLPLKTGIIAIDSAAIQRLLMHEIGHTLGLGHPNNNNPFTVAANLDTDNDPLNPMVFDPVDPFADLMVSAFPHNEAVMSNRPCGEPPVLPCAALLLPPQNDDLAGLKALYPTAPSIPAVPALSHFGLLLLALLLAGTASLRVGRTDAVFRQ